MIVSNNDTVVYVPMGSMANPAFVQHETRSSVQGKSVGITSSIMTANIPGVDLRQTTRTNGVLIDTSKNGIVT